MALPRAGGRSLQHGAARLVAARAPLVGASDSTGQSPTRDLGRGRFRPGGTGGAPPDDVVRRLVRRPVDAWAGSGASWLPGRVRAAFVAANRGRARILAGLRGVD